MGANVHLTVRATVRLILEDQVSISAVGTGTRFLTELNILGKRNVARSLAVGQLAARVLEGRALSPKCTSFLIDRKNNFCHCRICQLTFYGLGVCREVWWKSHQFWS